MTFHHPILPALCALLSSVVLAACGSAASGSAGAASAAAGAQDARYRYTQCLQKHGVTLPSRPPGAQGGQGGGADGNGGAGGFRRRLDNPTFQKAFQACRKLSPFDPANLTPQQRAERQDALVRFARCMRSHGVDVPDPTAAPGAGGGARIFRQARSNPAFQQAVTACRSSLPARPGGGGGFLFGGPPGGGAPGGSAR